MHARRHEHHRLLEPQGPCLLGEQHLIKQLLVLIQLVLVVVGRDGQQVQVPALGALGEDLLVEIEVIVQDEVVERQHVLAVVGVSIRVAEREVYLLRLVLEGVVEYALQL